MLSKWRITGRREHKNWNVLARRSGKSRQSRRRMTLNKGELPSLISGKTLMVLRGAVVMTFPSPDGAGKRAFLRSTITKRSVTVAGRKTSVSLEEEFWAGLKEVAAARNMGLFALVTAIRGEREHLNLSSALRLAVLDFYRDQIEQHRRRESAA